MSWFPAPADVCGIAAVSVPSCCHPSICAFVLGYAARGPDDDDADDADDVDDDDVFYVFVFILVFDVIFVAAWVFCIVLYQSNFFVDP